MNGRMEWMNMKIDKNGTWDKDNDKSHGVSLAAIGDASPIWDRPSA